MGVQRQFVKTIQRRHNAWQVCRAVGYGLLALFFWYLSFSVVRISVLLAFAVSGLLPPLPLISRVAWAGMALLAAGAGLCGRWLFDTGGARQSSFEDEETGAEVERLLAFFAQGPGAIAWRIMRTLFAAPRATVSAIRALRSLVFLRGDRLSAAEGILRDLARTNNWVPMAEYAGQDGELAGLARLGLVTSRPVPGGREVRIVPEVFSQHGVPRGGGYSA
jgi:hypothetical protein